MKLLSFIVIFGLIGIGVGYYIFGQFNGHFIPFFDLFMKPKNIIDNLGQAITGTAKIRQNILICGAVGAIAGLFLGITMGPRSRR